LSTPPATRPSSPLRIAAELDFSTSALPGPSSGQFYKRLSGKAAQKARSKVCRKDKGGKKAESPEASCYGLPAAEKDETSSHRWCRSD
jgi:hypothetical protein